MPAMTAVSTRGSLMFCTTVFTCEVACPNMPATTSPGLSPSEPIPIDQMASPKTAAASTTMTRRLWRM